MRGSTVTQTIRRYLAAAAFAAGAIALPFAAGVQSVPTTSFAQCPPGQTGVIYGCAPFCVEGKYLSPENGLCMPIAPPPPPAPRM